MATTVGSHSVSAFATPVNGGPLDANVVRGNDNTIRTAYVAHDADTGIHVQSSSLASRPSAGTAGRKWITADTGVYKLWYDDGTTWHEVAAGNIDVFVIADEALVKGDVVKVTGYNNGTGAPRVAKVSSASDVAFGIVNSTSIANGATGYITNTGLIQDVATNAFSVGDILYPNTSGGFTATKPTSGNYQPIAFVLRSNANNGVLYVEFSTPRIVERSDNTASTIVLRDASGNFSAGTITAGAVTSTGLVTFASLKGTGATTVTNILDEDNMASDSATALATQQSIKAYVDAKVATVDTLAEVLANGNTTGANNIIVTAGQKVTTDTIDETTSGAGVTIDSVLLKDDVVNATDIETGTVSANDGTLAITVANSTGALTLASALADSNLATISTAGKVANSATTATSANTASAIVARDASGNFTAGTITATLNGAAPAGSLSGSTLASGVTASSLTSVGTLTSLTVSGDLTVDTSTLKVDSANNRVGIGTATPSTLFHVRAATNKNFIVQDAGIADTVEISNYNTTDGIRPIYLSASTLSLATGTAGGGSTSTRMSIDASGNLAVDTNTLYVDAVNNRVGIGTASPTSTFAVSTASANTQVTIGNNSAYDQFIYFRGNNDWSMGMDYSNSNAFVISNTSVLGTNDRVVLTTDGNLGLGVTPSARLSITVPDYTASATNGMIRFQNPNTTGDSAVQSYYVSGEGSDLYLGANSYINTSGAKVRFNTGQASSAINIRRDGSITFATNTSAANASDKMTLDASGNLGVGTTGPNVGSWGRALTIQGASNAAYEVTEGTVRAAVFASGGTIGGLSVETNHPLGFYTNATERARITSGGAVLVNSTTVGGKLYVYNPATGFETNTVKAHDANASTTSDGVLSVVADRNTTNNTFYALGYYNNGAAAFKWRVADSGNVTNTNGTYGTISDIKHKQDVVDAPSQWDDLKAVRFRKFRMKSDVEAQGDDAPYLLGVVAQELAEVSPGLVEAHPDTERVEVTDEDGNVTTETRPTGTETLSVKSSILLMKAAVALQEAMARIEALEASNAGLLARLEALEA